MTDFELQMLSNSQLLIDNADTILLQLELMEYSLSILFYMAIGTLVAILVLGGRK